MMYPTDPFINRLAPSSSREMIHEQCDVEQRIAFHAQAALSLLPPTLNSKGALPIRLIRARAEEGDWRQVIYLLRSASRNSDFSTQLQWQLDAGLEYANVADRLGTRWALLHLSVGEKQIIRECLLSAALGPFFPDWEFQTLFGLARDAVLDIGMKWPDVGWDAGLVGKAVNNTFNNLLYYPHRKWDRWQYHVSVPPWWVVEVFREWRELTGRNKRTPHATDPAEAYFQNFE